MNTYKVIFTETADECLLNIAEYIALDSPARADDFIEELAKSITNTLSIFPFSGTVQFFENEIEIRRVPYKKYVCFYRVLEKKSVEILYIFNSAQNTKNLFKVLKEKLNLN